MKEQQPQEIPDQDSPQTIAPVEDLCEEVKTDQAVQSNSNCEKTTQDWMDKEFLIGFFS